LNRNSTLAAAFRILFVALLLGGILLLVVTGNDLFARVGVTGAVAIFLLWWTTLGTRSVIQKTRVSRYLDATLAALWYGGIALLIAYFISLLLEHMFDFRVVGLLRD
jgi:hypothetical protein